jgi:hypothetical protein
VGVLSYSVWIDASPISVWNVLTDLDRIPDWQTGAPRVVDRTGQGDAVGTHYTVRRGPTSSKTTVTNAERPGRYESRAKALLGLQIDLIANLVAQRGGTLLSLEARTAWPRGLRLLGRAVEFVVLNPREANRELANLKAVVERRVNMGER